MEVLSSQRRHWWDRGHPRAVPVHISGLAEAQAGWHMGGSGSVFVTGRLKRSLFASRCLVVRCYCCLPNNSGKIKQQGKLRLAGEGGENVFWVVCQSA